MAQTRIQETFNDGVLKFGSYKTIRAENRKITGKQFVELGRLFYRELSVRESDYLQFGAMGSTLDVKLKTLMPPSLRKFDKDKLIVRIDEQDYNIITVDRDMNYLYLYLHKMDGETNE